MLPDGMRISIFDRTRKPIFESESAAFTRTVPGFSRPWLGKWPGSSKTFNVEVEGHTESGRTPKRPEYGDWELSADRANAARRKLQEHDVEESQIRRVAAYGSTMPIPEMKPQDESNRRVTVLLKIKAGTRL